MALNIFHVDAFTDRWFGGNPAAVCLLNEPADPTWMQLIAAEFNLSETAFITSSPGGFGLRWFTPAAEVDLCGHATLASAHVLWETGQIQSSERIVFHTRSGALTCTRDNDGWITLDFPSRPAEECDPPAGLLESLGARAKFIGSNKMDYIVEAADEAIVRRMAPDFRALRGVDARGIIVTAESSTDEFDFVSRFFAPAVGVDEDPVTGSAHCCLAPFWAQRLGRNELTGYQASKRGGTVRVRCAGDCVHLIGKAVLVSRGALLH